MNNSYLMKIAYKSILLYKKETISKIISVFLATLIFFISTVLLTHLNVLFTPDYSKGNYHYRLNSTDMVTLPSQYKMNTLRSGNESIILNDIDYELYSFYNENILPFQIISGKAPESDDEILISNKLGFAVNETIKVTQTSTNSKKTYKVCGLYNDIENHNFYMYILNQTNHTIQTYYIRDDYFYLHTSKSGLSEITNIDINEIYTNQSLISSEKLQFFIEDSPYTKYALILILVINFFITYISLKCVKFLNLNRRQQQIGLLISIGASPKQIQLIFIYENMTIVLISTLLSIFIGLLLISLISGLSLKFIDIEIKWHKLIILTICFASLLYSAFIMLIYYYFNERYLLNTLPIYDLQQKSYEYPTPIKSKALSNKRFSWRMFLIYNQRLKFQTSALRNSFILMLVSSVILVCILLTNITFINLKPSTDYDILLKNNTYDGSKTTLFLDFVNNLYKEIDNSDIEIEYISVDRRSNAQILTTPNMYAHDWINDYKINFDKNLFIGTDRTGKTWTNFYHYYTVLDEYQLKHLEPYIVDGDINNLTNNSCVLILWAGHVTKDNPLLISRANVGNHVYEYNLDSNHLKDFIKNNDLTKNALSIHAIAVLPLNLKELFTPDTAIKDMHFPFERAEYTIARSYSTLKENSFNGIEEIKIKLKNSSLSTTYLNKLKNLMKENNVLNVYDYEIQIAEDELIRNNMIIMNIFILPISLLLCLLILINILNVFKSTSLIKEKDYKILREVGMSFKQQNLITLFEYLEGYINTLLILSPIVLIIYLCIFNKISVGIDYIFDNLIPSFIISGLIIGPLCILITYLKNKRRI